MRRTLENRVARQSALVVAITVAVAVGSLWTTARFLAISDGVEQSHEVIDRLKELKSISKTAESGLRGYLLTGGRNAYLKPFDEAKARAARIESELIAIVGGAPIGQRRLVERLKHVLSRRFDEMAETIRLARGGERADALQLVLIERGEQTSKEIGRIVDSAIDLERGTLAERAREARMIRTVKLAVDLAGATLSILILVAVYLVVSHEMSERKRAEALLAQARDAAEAASRAKGDFMANVSHEIRTPMNAILGMTELTLDTDLDPEQRENLLVVRSATDSLLAIINDLLDFSKMEAGKLELAVADFSLRELLGDILGLLGLRAFDKGLELACRIDPRVPDRLAGDSSRLRQVLLNLVGNAIKFTDRGEVVVEVDADAGADAESAVILHFRVIDTGIGIALDKREMVFAPFAQADGSTTRIYGGTGLGLTISSQIVALMGGRLWVESEPGLGSTFHFTARFGHCGVPVAAPLAPVESLQGLRVLVVDDNAVNRRILSEILTFWGMDPTVVEGGAAAIAELQRSRELGRPYSLVLLDALMPDMDGFEVARRIKADSALQASVLLMLTSSDRHGFAEIASSVGITACLNKPIQQNKLLETIQLAVTRPHGVGLDAGTAAPRRTVQSRPLRILMAEDNPFNQRVAVLLLARSGHAVTVANHGREAVEALDRGAFDLVLMDLQMPVMDGFQATAAIRSAEEGTGRHIPIIALTAHAMREDEERCLAAGMDGYVSKPIREANLLRTIDAILDRGEPAAVGDRESNDPASAIDVDAALARVDGDRQFLAEMAALFLEESPHQVEQIREALADGDLGGVVKPAHSLKNWAGNFAASASFAAIGRFEEASKTGRLSAARAEFPGLEREFDGFRRAVARFAPLGTCPVGDRVSSAIDDDHRSSPCIH